MNNASGPSPARERILCEAIYPFHYMTLEMIGRLLNYKEAAYNTVGQHLLKLIDRKGTEETDKGWLARFKLPTGYGLQPYVYMLGEKGKDYFRTEKEWEVPKLPSWATMQTRSYSFLMHLLEINNVIIAAKCLERYSSNVCLLRFEHDVALKKNPIITTSNNGKKITIVPDAVIEIEEASGRRVLWVELERGTNSDKYLLEKMNQIYDVFDRRVFQERVGTNRCRVCYLTTAGQVDVERLRRLARTVLSERKGETAAQSKRNMIFNFIAIPTMGTGDINVTQTFLLSSWLHPFNQEYVAILDVN